MKIVFVSNYINHHQIPFCKAMCRELEKGETGSAFYFIQTEPMEEERVRMGWKVETDLPYLKLYYREPEECRKLILESDVVLFGGCEEESYIEERLSLGKPVIRMSERLYREGQWKAVSPRGLRKKYHDHTRYRKKQVYLLCSGAYVPSDFHIVRAYPNKMYRWGYFTEAKQYDIEQLLQEKGYGSEKVLYLLWAARFLPLKHPEYAVYAAKRLKEKGIIFHMEMVGGGEMEGTIRNLIQKEGLEQEITLAGYLQPGEVRAKMEQADIYLMTSNRYEGWGAVVNESMNSGCAVVAGHMAGAVPYLIRQGENGLIYKDGNKEQFLQLVEKLAQDRELCRRLGWKAYETISREWNPENAASCLMELMEELGLVPEKEAGRWKGKRRSDSGPCSKTPVIGERQMYNYLTKGRELFLIAGRDEG